ncbi:adenylate/guanylate cyclase domain-containing protein [Nostoc sp. 3335mG]|nr:adenylate/guanylate cyclase domain-containing protein [Nostoc sp. 3335mG]
MAARAPRIETREHRRMGRLAIVAAIALLMLGVRLLPAWATIDGRAFDILSTISPPLPREPGAVIVAIDEPSFSALEKQWPWPRDIHAKLIERLRAAGVKAIGMDVIFADPSQPAADAALAGAARRDTVFAADETVSEDAQASTVIRTEPIPDLVANGALSGVASVSQDGDGVLRRMPRYPDGFAAQIGRAAGMTVTMPERPRLIQYLGPAATYPRVSYYQALDPAKYLPPDMLRGRTVIVGYSLQAAADLHAGATDAFQTPYTMRTGQLTPGVEVQATILDNLVHGLSIATLPHWLDWIAILAAAILSVLLGRSPHPSRKLALAVVAIVVTLAASWLLLRYGRAWLSPAGPSAMFAFAGAGLALRDYALERRLRRDVQGAFAQYLAPTMIERLVADPKLLTLGGEAREMTMLFSDVRGFTTISEAMKHDPQGLVRMINGILTPLSDVVVAHGGTIDKYMGDCVMAFWNAPLDDPDHALNAVRAGLDMVAALPRINEGIRAALPEGAPPVEIRVGVGINSGTCVVGNMGSDQRFDYSVLGDAVNIASRLEGTSKSYGVAIVVGEATAALIGDRLPLIEIDRIAVRGRSEPQAIYTILSDTDLEGIDLAALRAEQREFLAALREEADNAGHLGARIVARHPAFSSYVDAMVASRADKPTA